MENELRDAIWTAFSNCLEYKEVAALYHEIVAECEIQVDVMCGSIAKEKAQAKEDNGET